MHSLEKSDISHCNILRTLHGGELSCLQLIVSDHLLLVVLLLAFHEFKNLNTFSLDTSFPPTWHSWHSSCSQLLSHAPYSPFGLLHLSPDWNRTRSHAFLLIPLSPRVHPAPHILSKLLSRYPGSTFRTARIEGIFSPFSRKLLH